MSQFKVTPYIGGKNHENKNVIQQEFVLSTAPASTKYIHCYTIEHISYGQLLKGLEFRDKDHQLIARSGTSIDCRLTRF